MAKEHGTTTTEVIKGVSEATSEPGQSCLVVFYGQNLGKRYFLDKEEQIIGRSDSVHICVDQERVSRKHTHNIRREDVFARYGGEEFALVLPEPDREQAVQISEKLRLLIEEYRFSFSGKYIPVMVSFGVAVAGVRDKGESMQDFISCADAKLYEANQTGRNRVVG